MKDLFIEVKKLELDQVFFRQKFERIGKKTFLEQKNVFQGCSSQVV